jgi:hypothetical protein
MSDNIYSNVSVGGRRLTWRELAERREEEIRRLSTFAVMFSDLDRNERGRHESDADGFGVSEGNPHIRPGETFGYSIHGTRVYRMPPREQRHDPGAWIVRAEDI